ncbi:MAG: ABC transporter permease [Acidobacteriaceae bacterium]
MHRLISNLKLAFRQMAKSPGFAATAILMLAFGIGSTTAIFSVVDGILLRPLPFPAPQRLVTLGDQIGGTGWGSSGAGPVSATQAVLYTRDTHSFASLGTWQDEDLELSGSGEPARIAAARMTPGLFAALGVAPLMGRVFTEQEDTQRAPVAVLSYATWKNRFHGDGGILGRKIQLNREPYVVIGVMPRNFEFPIAAGTLTRCELWVPMSYTADELNPEEGANFAWGMVGRLKPGVTLAAAQSDAEQVAQEIMRGLPPDLASFHIRAMVHPLGAITVERAKPLLRLLFLAVVVVLLIACANLAGLLLVRAIQHQREIAVRLALGAPAGALLRQTLMESLALSLTGGVLGIGLAALAIRLGRDWVPASLPRIDDIRLNWTVVGFALALALLTGLVCGLAPAFAALRTDVNATLKEGGRSGSAGGNHPWLRSVLVVAEVAVALMLLTSSGLLLRSFSRMSNVDLGFNAGHAITGTYSLPHEHYANQEQVDAFNRELLQRMGQLPGTEAVALSNSQLSAHYFYSVSLVVEGDTNLQGKSSTSAGDFDIDGDFFHAAGIALLRGRRFTDADNADAPLVAIVNHEFAERYWPDQNPLGKRIRLGTPQMSTPWLTIVGEVADAKLGSPDQDAGAQFYLPLAQREKDAGSFASPEDINGNAGFILVRSALPPEQTEDALRRVVRSIDPQLPLTQVETLEQVVAHSEASRRFNTVLVSSFALAALLLAVLGIYSVIAFSTAARVQEMAIRMALGAERGDIVRLVLRSGLLLAAIGCIVGLAGAAAASSLLRSFLFDISRFDPLTMVGAAAAVLLLAIVASALPARRAASVDPMKALRG